MRYPDNAIIVIFPILISDIRAIFDIGKLCIRFTIQIAIAKRFLLLYFKPAGKIGAP
jgi:hypothetical protein